MFRQHHDAVWQHLALLGAHKPLKRFTLQRREPERRAITILSQNKRDGTMA